MQIQEVFDQKVKSDICNIILRELPDWFGVEASIVDYVSKVRRCLFMQYLMSRLLLDLLR